jgi:hypothetical protein
MKPYIYISEYLNYTYNRFFYYEWLSAKRIFLKSKNSSKFKKISFNALNIKYKKLDLVTTHLFRKKKTKQNKKKKKLVIIHLQLVINLGI